MGPEDNEDVYYGSSTDANDVRYADDCHQTYGGYSSESEED